MFSDKDESIPLSISAVEDYPSLRIVRLRGPINQDSVSEIERFRKWVENHKGFKHKHILLDLKSVTRVDTAAVAQIIQEVSDLKRKGDFRLGAINLPDVVRSMFQVLKVEKLIVVFSNESEALEQLTKKA